MENLWWMLMLIILGSVWKSRVQLLAIVVISYSVTKLLTYMFHSVFRTHSSQHHAEIVKHSRQASYNQRNQDFLNLLISLSPQAKEVNFPRYRKKRRDLDRNGKLMC